MRLVITGVNDDRLVRYRQRIEYKNEGDDYVAYKSDVPGIWEFATGYKSDQPEQEVKTLPAFYEARYKAHFFILDDKVTDCRIEHVMASVSDEFEFMRERHGMDGTLDFINEPGRFTFDIALWRGDDRQTVKLEWIVVSEKIDVIRDAKLIIDRVERAKSGFVYSFLTKTKHPGGISNQGNDKDSVWFDVFKSFVDRFRAACEWIVNSPHLKYQNEERYLRADRIRRWTPQQANRHAALPKDRKERYLHRSEEIKPITDTVENRFVKHTLKVITARLTAFMDRCKASRRDDGQGGVSKACISRMDDWKRVLERLSAHSFFKGIGRFTGFKQESLALQRKRGYSKIQETWIALQHAIDVLSDDGMDVGNQPMWKLYEFWCFIMIYDILVENGLKQISGTLGNVGGFDDVMSDEDVDSEVEDENVPDRHEKGGNVCKYEFRDESVTPNRIVTLTYQQSYWGNKAETGSNIVEQIPDIVLTIRDDDSEGKSYTYLFDAKYRICSFPSKKNAQKDAAPFVTLNDMHRYRDAILYRRQTDKKLSREIIGAYVLYPGRSDHSYDYETIIKEENIGAIPLLPTSYQRNTDGTVKLSSDGVTKLFDGKDGEAALRKFIADILGRKTKQEHLGIGTDGYAKVLSTRGTTVVVGESQGPFVVVGYCKSDDHYQWVHDQLLYNLRIGDENGAIKPTPELLAARYLLIHCEGEQNRASSLFEIDTENNKLVGRSHLLEMHYPKENESEEKRKEGWHYLVLKLRELDLNHPLYAKMFNVSMLNGFGSGRRSAIPFVTTETDLIAHVVS